MRAVTSASNIFRRELCEGSERMETGLPEENSEQSEEGRILHKHAEKPEIDRSKLTQNQRDLLNYNEQAVKEVFRRIELEFGEVPAGVGGRETTWWLHRGIKSVYPGHPDLFEYAATHKLLVVLDYKFGFKVVTPADANRQTRSYACMGAELFDCDHVVVAITQPRLPFADRITMAIYNREEIEASRQQLFQIWDNAKKPDAPLVAGEEQCRYCKAKLLCPAYKAKFLQLKGVFNGADLDGSKTKRQATIGRTLSECSDEDLDKVLVACQFAGFVEETARDIARERKKQGGMVNYELGKPGEVRNVTDVGRAVELLLGVGLPKDKIMAACSMALGDDGGIADVYRTVKNGTWKETKDEINALLAEVIERYPKKPSLTRMKDVKAFALSIGEQE